jgi:hypothetical protein
MSERRERDEREDEEPLMVRLLRAKMEVLEEEVSKAADVYVQALAARERCALALQAAIHEGAKG